MVALEEVYRELLSKEVDRLQLGCGPTPYGAQVKRDDRPRLEGHSPPGLLPHGTGTVELELTDQPEAGATAFVPATFRLDDLRDLSAAVERVRRLLDADCDPVAVDDAFAGDPVLGPLVASHAGAAGARARRRRRARRPRRARPAGDRGGARTAAARLAADATASRCRASRRRRRLTHLFPTRRRLADARPRVAADAARARPRPDRAVPGAGRGDVAPRPRRRPRRRPRAPCWRSRASGPGPPTTSRCGRSATPTCSCPPTSASATPCAGLGRDPAEAAAPRDRVEPVALLRPAAPVAHPQPPRPRPRRTDMWTVMDSPVGELRIVEHGRRDHRDRVQPVPRPRRPPARRPRRRPPAAGRGGRASCARTSTATSRSSTCRSRRPAATSSSRCGSSCCQIGYGETASYGEIAHRLGKYQRRLARRRPGQRPQPDPDRDPVPPGDRRRRHPHRLRRRHRAQADAARARAGRALLTPVRARRHGFIT